MQDNPGWKTSEFRFKLLTMVISMFILGGVGIDLPIVGKIATIALLVLNSLGYDATRAVVKRERLRSASDIIKANGER